MKISNNQIKIEDQAPQETPSETFARFMLGMFHVARVMHQELQNIAEKAAPYLNALAKIDWAAVKQRLDELPKKSKDAMRLALAEGWFFGWHDDLQGLMELVESLEAAQSTTINNVMVAYYRTNLQPFTIDLVNKYPDRAAAIKAAVYAHTSLHDVGYLLSIPVFIAQADGLLAKITGVASPARKAALNGFREKYAADPELLNLLSPFLELNHSAFMMSAKAREDAAHASGKSFTALNRHQVMHGECSSYGTKINSLKAFSFLVFAGLHTPAVLMRDTSEVARGKP